MYEQEVHRLNLALDLKRQVVGVKFLYTWAEFQDSPLPQFQNRTRFCYMVMQASQGERFKSDLSNFGCGCSREALGIEAEDPTTTSGEMYYGCGLCADARRACKWEEGELGIAIDPGTHYGIMACQWDRKRREDAQRQADAQGE